MKLQIQVLTQNPTVQFATLELERYIAALHTGEPGSFAIQLGLYVDTQPTLQHEAAEFDDEIYIDVQAGSGIVAGINPRSCLQAAYRLLREAGCRFLRPGANGEYIPAKDWRTVTVRLHEKPSYRHRGICIEGGVSRELFLDTIDWLPKNGMNAYFVQFRSGHTFFDRWYTHQYNPLVKSEPKTAEEIRAIVEEGIAAVKLRGMIYHEMGHGWTCEPLGIPGRGWDVVEQVAQGTSDAFALVNGRRELWGGIPLNTNLCYGNPQIRNLVVDYIVAYIQDNPNIDILHFWLADGMNNHCECPLCADTRPSDFYVEMLNLLDERLTRLGSAAKIVFLIYFDLLWPPEKQRLVNADRFILMFAPITRTYSKTFSPAGQLPQLPPYVRNRLTFPASVGGNVAFLKAWQAFFSGDSFDFDYHLLWDQFKVPGYEELSKVLHGDIRNLTDIGLNGYMSCQVHRTFFPSPLPTAVLAQTLWNRDADYGAIADDLYRAAYGKTGVQVRENLKRFSAQINPPWLRMEEPTVDVAQTRRLQDAAATVQELRTLIAGHTEQADACRQESWRLLLLFCDYADKHIAFSLQLSRGDAVGARSALDELLAWAYTQEESLGYALDCDTLRYTLEDVYKQMVKRL